jgi:hypothetical protein
MEVIELSKTDPTKVHTSRIYYSEKTMAPHTCGVPP